MNTETKKEQKKDVQQNDIKINFETITPAIAKEILETQNQHNRDPDQHTIDYYADLMQRGLWRETPETISFDKYVQLIDGQHRLAAQVKADYTLTYIVARGYEREVFKVINMGKLRTSNDIFKMENVKNSQLIATGIRKYMMLLKGSYGKTSNKKAKLSIYDFIETYEQDRELYDRIATAANTFYSRIRLVSNGDYFGYMALFLKQTGRTFEEVTEFFNQLSSFSDNHAINELRLKLIKARDMKQYALTYTQIHAFMYMAWNSYITKIPSKNLKFTERDQLPELQK